MTAAIEALYDFFSGFGLPAYAEGFIPDDAELPYITFSTPQSGIDAKASQYVRVWYEGTDNSEPARKADAIIGAIGRGIMLTTDSGAVVIWPESPLVQVQKAEDSDRDVCYAYINLSINDYTYMR